ncbi:MAG: YidB family protein [Halioglobus sp.]|nr:YidB family protein [Halioglobus sp.]
MDIAQLATQLFSEKMGQEGGEGLTSALSSLLGDGQGGFDLAGLASKMSQNGDLGDIVGSWLGDGENSPISADKLLGLLGEDQVADFASQVGTDPENAANSLAEVLPQVMDQASSGGNLLDSVGGVEGLLGAASSLFK